MGVPIKSLDIGCGKNKVKGAIGIDRIKLEGVDVVWDLDQFPYPFADNSFDEIYATHVIEHLDSVVTALEEIYRLAKPNAKVTIVTPHYSDSISWTDPTHRWHLTSYSFRYFDPDYATNYYTKARFHTESIRIDMARIWRSLGIQFMLNGSIRYESLRFIRKFWENYLCLLVRAQAMTFVLRALK
ncbi:MAG: class I SAM-dependent methyltransferase [Acidobacteria bacterium]|nr:class I SAM-dependent methyltransferase [Acidobacteriota bacterium]MBI3658412.1 class I SAM-dependent methyltransferase [Acidobacteriota bacterium]